MNGIVSGIYNVTLGANLGIYTRVKRNANNVMVAAGVGETADGVLLKGGSTGDLVEMWPTGLAGKVKGILSGVCAVGDRLYPAAAGAVSTTAAGDPVGIAIEIGQNGGEVVYATVPPASGNRVRGGAYTVTAGDVAATYAAIEAGFGVAPTFFLVNVTSAAGAVRAITTVATNGTTKRVTITGITAGDIVNWLAGLGSNPAT